MEHNQDQCSSLHVVRALGSRAVRDTGDSEGGIRPQYPENLLLSFVGLKPRSVRSKLLTYICISDKRVVSYLTTCTLLVE